ncbi:hypothetical protein ES705_42861 [subsurface metagenome]
MAADKYANQGYVFVVPTLNTLSFAELATFVSVFEKKAFLVNRIEYFLGVDGMEEMDAEADTVSYGLSTSNKFASANIAEPTIFDFNNKFVVLQAAGVSSHIISQPFVKDLSTLPGGGALVPCRPIFLFMVSTGWVAASRIDARIYFTVVDLKAEEYWELVEATRLVGT